MRGGQARRRVSTICSELVRRSRHGRPTYRRAGHVRVPYGPRRTSQPPAQPSSLMLFSSLAPLVAQALPPVEQEYLLQARQMQALSFAVHIPLVCFGIAFPSMVLLSEWLHYRTGDQVFRVLARRWPRVLAGLFAVGVITGTVLSCEMRLLWPAFTGTSGAVFALEFATEGLNFVMEAI